MQLLSNLVGAGGMFVHHQRDHAHLLAKIVSRLLTATMLSASAPIFAIGQSLFLAHRGKLLRCPRATGLSAAAGSPPLQFDDQSCGWGVLRSPM
jgi:hypothetical protein